MANECYTLIVVPHARARFRKFQVSVRLTKWVLGAFGVMALVLVGHALRPRAQCGGASYSNLNRCD